MTSAKPVGEFELINRYFKSSQPEQDGVVLGIGDDAALVQPTPGNLLAVASDTLVADVHFPANAPARQIAERSLRVNLSDMAAMAARPRWFTLSLTLPKAWASAEREAWVAEFSYGLKACADHYECVLIGGDTTSGPLCVSIQMLGEVAPGTALRRDGAQVGDFVLVTGTLGDAAAALPLLNNPSDSADDEYLLRRYFQPEPRVAEAMLLSSFASSAQDISDGLLADLGHICDASDVAAEIDLNALPLSDALINHADAHVLAASGGDDYELVFTVAMEQMPHIAELQARGDLQASVIGRIVTGAGVHCELDGQPFVCEQSGYEHF